MTRCTIYCVKFLAEVFADISPRDESDEQETECKRAKGILADIVPIIVGSAEDAVTIPVHRSFLCKKSKYFEDAFEEDQQKSSFEFPEEEPEIFERIMNWIYGEGFLLPEDQTSEDDAEASEENQSHDEPKSLNVSHLLSNGNLHRETVRPEPSEKIINLDELSDFSDNEQEAQSPLQTAIEANSPTPLDTLTLSKIYAVAELLGMDRLRNEIIELLGQRLGHDMKTPGPALTYAFDRCDAGSPLRGLLVDFTARSAPIYDLLKDPTFDATPELWRALVEELTRVRGADVLRQSEWVEHFESTLGEYRVPKRS